MVMTFAAIEFAKAIVQAISKQNRQKLMQSIASHG
jgi:hypothetical protein